MERPVFISYASEDKTHADLVCDAIEKAGTDCWIAPRNIPPGTDFAKAIVQGIDEARIIVLIYSAAANDSRFVKLEINWAVSRNMLIVPFRIENHTPTETLGFFLGLSNWIDAFGGSIHEHLKTLLQTVASRLRPAERASAERAADRQTPLAAVAAEVRKLHAATHAPSLDEVNTLIGLAISFGAPIYNAGSHKGCAEIYLETARGLVAALAKPVAPHGADSEVAARLAAIRTDLHQASSMDPAVTPENANRFAWALRGAFDRTLRAELVGRAIAHVDNLLAKNSAHGAGLDRLELHEILRCAIAYGNVLFQEGDLPAIVTLHLHTARRLLTALPEQPATAGGPDGPHLAAARAELAPFRDTPVPASPQDAKKLAWRIYETFRRILEAM